MNVIQIQAGQVSKLPKATISSDFIKEYNEIDQSNALVYFLIQLLIRWIVKLAHHYENGRSYQALKSNPSLLHESIRYVAQYPLLDLLIWQF